VLRELTLCLLSFAFKTLSGLRLPAVRACFLHHSMPGRDGDSQIGLCQRRPWVREKERRSALIKPMGRSRAELGKLSACAGPEPNTRTRPVPNTEYPYRQ
jgi:hypothetical protein